MLPLIRKNLRSPPRTNINKYTLYKYLALSGMNIGAKTTITIGNEVTHSNNRQSAIHTANHGNTKHPEPK